ncbi:MAG: sensory box histidine kinase [Bacteroidota bacterium]|nr:sensory box histidine kinase [Bacteroidota bacterium]
MIRKRVSQSMNIIKHPGITARLMVESSPNAMVLIDRTGEIIFANRKTENLFGYSKEELSGQNIETIFPVREPEDIFYNPKENLSGAVQEFSARKKEGDVLAVEVGVNVLVSDGDTITLAVITDITARKIKEAGLAESEKQFREFFENAPEAILVLDVASLTFVLNNTNALNLLKLSEEDLRKKGITDISPVYQSDGRLSEEKARELVIKAMYGDKMVFEWSVLDAEENEILCEVRLIALPGTAKRQLLASFIDIVERKKEEKLLIATNNRLKFRLDNALLGFVEWDTQLQVTTWSKRANEIFGWSALEVTSREKNGYSLIHNEDLPLFDEAIQQILSRRIERRSVQCRCNTKNDEPIWCEWFVSVVTDEMQNVIGLMTMVEDISERKTAEAEINALNEHLEDRVSERTAELTEANKELESFSYSVSHDLRVPLRSIHGFTKIIQKDYSAGMSPDMKELFEHVENNAERMNVIINDLLNLAKYGKEKLVITTIDMKALFIRVWANIKRRYPHNAILEISDLPKIEADISLMEQVLINLLSNAIKYSAKKGNPIVKVGFVEKECGICFFIKDNGAGFNMKYYERLFEPFQRLHNASEFEGTGVGLVLVKRIVGKHNGSVWAEGIVDEGATFWFNIPQFSLLLT